jgi:hypothetical protein
VEAWLVGAALAGSAGLYLLPARVKFAASRVALAVGARNHPDVTAGVLRAVAASFVPWTIPALVLRRGGIVVQADACSLGWLKDDPPYTWWWVRSDAETPTFTLVTAHPRRWVDKHTYLDLGLALPSGDAGFDARFVVTMHGPNADCVAVATAMLASPTVRSLIEALVATDDDDCVLGSHISLTRRRVGASSADAIEQMERVATLARTIEEIFVSKIPYR